MTITEPVSGPGETIWSEQAPFITKKARDLSRSFNHVVEEEDLLQEAWVFCWEKEAYFFENNCRNVYIRRSIENVMVNYAKKMRDQLLRNSDWFVYASEEVRELLPTFLSSYEAWTTSPVPDGASTMTKNDNVEIFVDFSRAWDKLTDSQQDLLSRRFAESEEFPEAKDRKALSRAVNKFVDYLNQNRDIDTRAYQGPGSRKVMTNAAGLSAVRQHD